MIPLLAKPVIGQEAASVDKESFGHRLGELRRAAGLSRAQLAEATGIPARTLEAWEHGRREPYVTAIPRLVEALGVEPNALFIDPAADAPPPKRGRPRKPKGDDV